MTAAEIVSACERERDSAFDAEVARWPEFFAYGKVREWMTEPNGLYYRMLRAYARAFGPVVACEIGTRHGSSALALAAGGADVDSYDIDLREVAHAPTLASLGVTLVKLDRPDDCHNLPFGLYNFLFVDIGSHEGRHERAVHERLVAERWKGVVFYDDINWGMRPFWDSIPQDKAETDWHGGAGFGVAVYGGPHDPP